MKHYNQLTLKEKELAIEKATNELLGVISMGALTFDDNLNNADFQARIDKGVDEAEKMRTPWFVGEYIMDAVGQEIKSMASADAQEALYPEPGEFVLSGVCQK